MTGQAPRRPAEADPIARIFRALGCATLTTALLFIIGSCTAIRNVL